MQTELYTKDKSRMETSDMAMVSKYGQMEANTKDTGKMEQPREEESSTTSTKTFTMVRYTVK